MGFGLSDLWWPKAAYDVATGGIDLSSNADKINQQRQGLLNQQGAAASGFSAGAGAGFRAGGQALDQQAQNLQALAEGKNSISAEQLRQGLGQQLAQQQSMAAGANPNNAAMAARNAAMNMGQASYGMAGQQAVAGMDERQRAQQALAQMLLQQRQQNLQGFLGGNQNAMTAYGSAAPTSDLYKATMGAVGGLAGGLGTAMSDRRLKRDIVAEADDSKKSKQILANLKPYSFRYKDEKYGEGDQYGVMAQDLKKAGLGHAVMETPYGLAVHGAKAATSALALTASLAKRLAEIEKEREGRGRRASTEDGDG